LIVLLFAKKNIHFISLSPSLALSFSLAPSAVYLVLIKKVNPLKQHL
jgi:hypothetical protein